MDVNFFYRFSTCTHTSNYLFVWARDKATIYIHCV